LYLYHDVFYIFRRTLPTLHLQLLILILIVLARELKNNVIDESSITGNWLYDIDLLELCTAGKQTTTVKN